MDAPHLLMVAAGVALAAWNTWQRLGRSNAARIWAKSEPPARAERKVLVVWPLLALVLLGAGLTGLLPTGSALSAVLFVVLAVALLVALAYILAPLPVPDALRPAWVAGFRRRRARG